MKNLLALFSLVLGLLITVSACGGSGGGGGGGTLTPTQQPTNLNTGTVTGRVSDQAGAPLGAVQVTIGSGATAKTARSNEQGFFVVGDVTPGEHSVRYEHTGYVTNTKRCPVVARQNAQVSITMQSVGTTQTVDTTQAQTITHRGGKLDLPANGVVNAAGQPVREVVVQMTTMVPGDPNFEVSMPGDFTGVDGGNRVDLVSYGVVDVELRDAAGNDLQLAAGSNATLEFPLPPNDPGDATIPLWWFDSASGDWIREGDATRDAASGVYRGQVTHFTPWNCDKGRPTATKVVRLLYEGRPVAGISVRLRGEGWLAGGVTGVDGQVAIPVGANAPPWFPSSADVLILLPDGTWRRLRQGEVMPGPGQTKVNEFDETDGVVEPIATVILEWGERPTDLDAHMTVPTTPRFHIYYPRANRGRLDASPWANLDTDDVTSFGPEIITLGRALPGTYRYTIKNFSGNGQHPITQSGARITLVLRGLPTRVYPVPAENPSNGNYWAVFDLTFDAAGTPTVTDLNVFGGSDLLMTS